MRINMNDKEIKDTLNDLIKLLDRIDIMTIEENIDDLMKYADSDNFDCAKDCLDQVECNINEALDFLICEKYDEKEKLLKTENDN